MFIYVELRNYKEHAETYFHKPQSTQKSQLRKNKKDKKKYIKELFPHITDHVEIT